MLYPTMYMLAPTSVLSRISVRFDHFCSTTAPRLGLVLAELELGSGWPLAPATAAASAADRNELEPGFAALVREGSLAFVAYPRRRGGEVLAEEEVSALKAALAARRTEEEPSILCLECNRYRPLQRMKRRHVLDCWCEQCVNKQTLITPRPKSTRQNRDRIFGTSFDFPGCSFDCPRTLTTRERGGKLRHRRVFTLRPATVSRSCGCWKLLLADLHCCADSRHPLFRVRLSERREGG